LLAIDWLHAPFFSPKNAKVSRVVETGRVGTPPFFATPFMGGVFRIFSVQLLAWKYIHHARRRRHRPLFYAAAVHAFLNWNKGAGMNVYTEIRPEVNMKKWGYGHSGVFTVFLCCFCGETFLVGYMTRGIQFIIYS
jgi:hypothetical protein